VASKPSGEGGETSPPSRSAFAGASRSALMLVVTTSFWLSGCTTTVHPPARVADPAQIGVLDHGRHASLILESSGGDMVRYAYGDWNWFALRQTGPLEASAAVLWPTRAALGRMRLRGPSPRRWSPARWMSRSSTLST
jgi:hypothetical protein